MFAGVLLGYHRISKSYRVATADGKAISDLMVIQAQEMAKKMNPDHRNEGSVGWDDDVFEVAVHTGNVRGAGTDAQQGTGQHSSQIVV